jgi:purine-binding chemotaxis protein CheW
MQQSGSAIQVKGNLAGKYLLFELGREEFGIQVGAVREIMRLQHITAVPQTPDCVRGVLNLRGKVIPVIDLRRKFGFCEAADTHRSCIVVIQVAGAAGPSQLGVIVDGVSEVLNISGADIEDTPDLGAGTEVRYCLGMAKVKERVKILLDINSVLSARELGDLRDHSMTARA